MNEALKEIIEGNIPTASNEAIRDFIRISALQRIKDIEPYFLLSDYVNIINYLKTGDEFYKKDVLWIVDQMAYSGDFGCEISDDTKETLSMILSLKHDEEDFEVSVESTSCSNGTISISWH